MATKKHEKIKEAKYREDLEWAINEILSGQELMIEELHKLLAALEKAEKTPPVKKVETRRKPK